MDPITINHLISVKNLDQSFGWRFICFKHGKHLEIIYLNCFEVRARWLNMVYVYIETKKFVWLAEINHKRLNSFGFVQPKVVVHLMHLIHAHQFYSPINFSVAIIVSNTIINNDALSTSQSINSVDFTASTDCTFLVICNAFAYLPEFKLRVHIYVKYAFKYQFMNYFHRKLPKPQPNVVNFFFFNYNRILIKLCGE